VSRFTHIATRLPHAALLVVLVSACSSNAPGGDSPDGTPPKVGPGDGADPQPDKPKPEPEPAQLDLSTDEAVRAAYKKETGKELDADDGCIGRTGVKDVIVIGSFAHDRGCDVVGAFVNGKLLDPNELSQEGLSLAGWREMGADERPSFALQWAEKVVFHWGGSFVAKSEKAFEFEDTPTFVAPASTTEGEEVVVRMWVEEPPGMQDRDDFNLVELRISADGAVSRAVKDSFGVPGERVR
jgi:hypothetical protein